MTDESGGLPPSPGVGKEPGWYPIRDNANTQAYWDGTVWTAGRRWTGASWADAPLESLAAPGAHATHSDGPVVTESTKRSGPMRWIVALVVVVVIAAGVSFALLSSSPTALKFVTGSTSGTFEISVARTTHPSFSGTIAGRPLSGSVTGDFGPKNGIAGLAQGSEVGFLYAGELGGHPYHLRVALTFAKGGSAAFGGIAPAFKVTGSYGSEPVTASAKFDLSNLNSKSQSLSVPFTGHVGSQILTGTAIASSPSSPPNAPITVKATFVVS